MAGFAVAALGPLTRLVLVAVGAASAWGAHCVCSRQVMHKTQPSVSSVRIRILLGLPLVCVLVYGAQQ